MPATEHATTTVTVTAWVSQRCRKLVELWLVLAFVAVGLAPAWGDDTATLLWQIGRGDNDDREFALAPNRYSQFREDAFFVVGKSDPRHDWPYVQPGPADAWAGGRAHTFVIVFGLQRVPESGQCKLRLDLLDTQRGVPPTLQIQINGREFQRRLPHGAGDASIFGDPAAGQECKCDIAFPAELLRTGPNEIALTTRSGSWLIYDSLGLEAPAGVQLGEVTGTVLGTALASSAGGA